MKSVLVVGGAKKGRIWPGRVLVSFWAGAVSSGCGFLWKKNNFLLLLTWGKAQSLVSSLLCPKHLYEAKIIVDLLP